jgi:kelch-like protein 19
VIKRDELNVRCESDVFRAVVRWIEYSEKERIGKFENLLSAVRCHFLTPRFLAEQLQLCGLLTRAPHCRDYLARILEDLHLHKRVRERRRTPQIPQVIFCVGGYFKKSLNNVECFNVAQNQWYKLAPLPVPRSGVAVCCMEGIIYVIGGKNNSQSTDDNRNTDSAAVNAYDPVTNIWRKCTCQ